MRPEEKVNEKLKNGTIGNRTRNHPAFSTVPQPTGKVIRLIYV